jgi:AraC-like DNA-binding protein
VSACSLTRFRLGFELFANPTESSAAGKGGDDPLTAIDPMLVRLVGKLIDALGETAGQERVGNFAKPVETWSGRDVMDFVERLRQRTGDDYWGLGAGPCAYGVSDFVIELGARCATLRDAIVMGFRFMAMTTQAMSFRLVEEGDRATIEIRQAPSPRDPEQALSDWTMIVWHKLPQWLIGAEIWLDHTEFEHGLDAAYSAYVTMFGGDCAFNADACRLSFARTYLDRRVVMTPAQAELLKYSTPGYFARPAGLSTTWKQLVSNRLRVEIAAGEPASSLDDFADEFGISGQTLRRRLGAEGTSYRALKAEARREVALDVLADDKVTLSEASIAAGFAEPNALTRALKTRLGVSAKDLREQVRSWRGPDGPPKPPRGA